MSTHNIMFLWRIRENYLGMIIKDSFESLTTPLFYVWFVFLFCFVFLFFEKYKKQNKIQNDICLIF